jgi:lactate dehydrogenase-like 2-hydroxyacid dehydrogenase
MKRIVVYRELPDVLLEQLQAQFEVRYFPEVDGVHRDAFAKAVVEADGMLGATLTVGRPLLEPARRLRVISSVSVGYDNFDLDYLTRRGILLTNTPDVLSETTADTMLALMLATARRVVELAELVKSGGWHGSVSRVHYGVDVHGKTLGMLGLGRIGQAVARRARLGFRMNILYHGRHPVPAAEAELDARHLPLDALLAQSDFVCVMLPLTPATDRLIGKREFSLMKRSAIFINGARGRIVDEAALIAALREGLIHGAGLDVFEREPLPADSPLLSMPNVVALPHIGSATHETRHAMAALAVDNLIAAFEGRAQNVVNPVALQSEASGGEKS